MGNQGVTAIAPRRGNEKKSEKVVGDSSTAPYVKKKTRHPICLISNIDKLHRWDNVKVQYAL
jgi:hypothetical protein